jgi:LDH2 family malate/lactate/ureidoglycolate dehydrogenase
VLERGPATALVDGDNGMGHLVMTHAANLVEIARDRCRLVGIHAHPAGRGLDLRHHPACTAWSDRRGLVELMVLGGAEPLLGTNPIAVAIPAGKEPPIVLDIATSVASNGAIRTYANEGRPLPVGWVINREDGEPITDGKRLGEGMFVPVGTYKGSGLAIVLGLLGGPLNRAAFGRDVKDTTAEQVKETNTGHLMIALDVKRFLPLDNFKAEIDRHVQDLSTSKRLPGVDEIRIPGQGRVKRRADREQNGVPLAESLIKQVDDLAGTLGIKPLTSSVSWKVGMSLLASIVRLPLPLPP